MEILRSKIEKTPKDILEEIKISVDILLSQLKRDKYNRLTKLIKIPFGLFEKNNITRGELEDNIKSIADIIKEKIKSVNDAYIDEITSHGNEKTLISTLDPKIKEIELGVTINELSRYLVLKLENKSSIIKKLSYIKKYINKNIKTKAYNKEIKTIEIINNKKDFVTCYINTNYQEPFNSNNSKNDGNSWKQLRIIALTGSCKLNTSVLNYFNTNENNPLYKKLKYQLKKILKESGDCLIAEKDVTIQSITDSKINRSLGQKKKNK